MGYYHSPAAEKIEKQIGAVKSGCLEHLANCDYRIKLQHLSEFPNSNFPESYRFVLFLRVLINTDSIRRRARGTGGQAVGRLSSGGCL